jgi:hypothetical protein
MNMQRFFVTVKTAIRRLDYYAIAPNSFSAYQSAFDAQDGRPCAITVRPV